MPGSGLSGIRLMPHRDKPPEKERTGNTLILLGITPDYEVRTDRELLDEIHGPMFRHGLQDMHGLQLTLPKRLSERPSRESLARRFAEFSA